MSIADLAAAMRQQGAALQSLAARITQIESRFVESGSAGTLEATDDIPQRLAKVEKLQQRTLFQTRTMEATSLHTEDLKDDIKVLQESDTNTRKTLERLTRAVAELKSENRCNHLLLDQAVNRILKETTDTLATQRQSISDHIKTMLRSEFHRIIRETFDIERQSIFNELDAKLSATNDRKPLPQKLENKINYDHGAAPAPGSLHSDLDRLEARIRNALNHVQ